jgi:hypothetical protein
MKSYVCAFVFACLALSTPAFAADVDGKWAGNISTPNGDFPVSYEFKADGTTLTGSTGAPDGSQVPIKDGKVEGSNISFAVSLDFGGMPFEIAYKGVVAPDEIKITGEFGGMPFEFVVKKVK